MAEIRRPPLLRVRHHCGYIFLQLPVVQLLELLSIVELLAHRVGELRVLVQQIQPQVVGPPVAVAPPRVTSASVGSCGVVKRALCLAGHLCVRFRLCFGGVFGLFASHEFLLRCCMFCASGSSSTVRYVSPELTLTP